jgi:glutamate dehydrogenase (NAD(P)+)
VVCIQDQFSTVFNNNGIDVSAVLKLRDQTGRIDGVGNVECIDTEAFWDVDCEILIPAALESQITAQRAQRIKARLVLEGANGPTLPEGDDVLHDRGIAVVPDVICNAGGVIVSYFEWVQDFSSFFWSEAEINQRLDNIIVQALQRIFEVADRLNVTTRVAAFTVACERILMARQERGLYP